VFNKDDKKKKADEHERELAVYKLSEEKKRSPLRRTVSALKRTTSRRTLEDFNSHNDKHPPVLPPAEHTSNRSSSRRPITRVESKKQVRFEETVSSTHRKKVFYGSP
jgi:hypothetical protein